MDIALGVAAGLALGGIIFLTLDKPGKAIFWTCVNGSIAFVVESYQQAWQEKSSQAAGQAFWRAVGTTIVETFVDGMIEKHINALPDKWELSDNPVLGIQLLSAFVAEVRTASFTGSLWRDPVRFCVALAIRLLATSF